MIGPAAEAPAWLLRDVRPMFGAARQDVRIRAGVVVAIGDALPPQARERVIDGHGAALLPGLHDHHLHLQALAAARASLRCGPPAVPDSSGLEAALRAANAAGAGAGWLRGVGYHECVAGDIDRDWLDRRIPDRPARIQHRSGRMWILNGAALRLLGPPGADAPRAARRGYARGRFLDLDEWLRYRLPAWRPSLAAASRELARRGVTGLTDATPRNDLAQYAYFAAAQRDRQLLQRLLVMGDASLDGAAPSAQIAPGPTKLHFHEHALPEFDALCGAIARSHAAGRPIAAHCVTITELAFVVGALAEAGTIAGDRIEHGAEVPDEWLGMLCEAGVTVITQPNFVFERGDRYLAEVAPDIQASLYRARSLRDAGIAVAAGTDAPFGEPDPWRAMEAAVERRTRSGLSLGADESLSPEQACALFLGAPCEPGRPRPGIAVGMAADLCLLDRDWDRARVALGDVQSRLTLLDGEAIWDDTHPTCDVLRERGHDALIRESHAEPAVTPLEPPEYHA